MREIKLFAATANSSLRLTDFVVRLGGEEFAAIMPGTLQDGLVVAQRIRAAFEIAARTVSGRYVGATVSIGRELDVDDLVELEAVEQVGRPLG